MSDERDAWTEDKPAENNSLVDSLKPAIDAILGVRDSIGAKIRDVYLMERVWDGDTIGAGGYKDRAVQMLPTPQIVDYSHSLMVHEGGAVRSGDIILKNISKNSYPKEEDIDCRVHQDRLNVQRFYLINNREYNVIHVKDSYVTWEVQLRKIDKETEVKT